MSEWNNQPGTPGLADSGLTEGDYRLREAEARFERRLQAMERRHGRTAWLARLSAVGFVGTLAMLAWTTQSVMPSDGAWSVRDLSAEEIVLRDADGMARGVLGTDADGQAHMALSDRDGRERIRLTVLADGSPGVTISDRDANPRAVLGYLPDGTTNLVFADAQGVGRAMIGLDGDGSARAMFTDASGAIRSLVGVDASGEPVVSTFESGDGTPPRP
jgi:hypothetical protein